MYPNYKFHSLLLAPWALCQNVCQNYLKIIGISEKESKVLLPQLVIKSITATVKICKTFLNFSDPFNNFN